MCSECDEGEGRELVVVELGCGCYIRQRVCGSPCDIEEKELIIPLITITYGAQVSLSSRDIFNYRHWSSSPRIPIAGEVRGYCFNRGSGSFRPSIHPPLFITLPPVPSHHTVLTSWLAPSYHYIRGNGYDYFYFYFFRFFGWGNSLVAYNVRNFKIFPENATDVVGG